MIDQRPELLDIAIAARPSLIAISFGDPAPHVARLHDEGILVASQVQSRAWAETALAAGVDVLVAQGTEGGGHTGSVGTLPLLQIVLELTDRPVLAAGGIATGRGLAAVLAAGAVGRLGRHAVPSRRRGAQQPACPRRESSRATRRKRCTRVSTTAFRTRPGRPSSAAVLSATRSMSSGLAERTSSARGARLGRSSGRRKRSRTTTSRTSTPDKPVGLLDTVSPAATIVSTIEKQAERLLAAPATRSQALSGRQPRKIRVESYRETQASARAAVGGAG